MHVYNVEEVTDIPGGSEDDDQPFSTDHLQHHLASFVNSCHGDDQTAVYSTGLWADQELYKSRNITFDLYRTF